MSNKIFDVEEFENLNGPQIQQLGNTIYQRFAQKRNYYHQSRNSQFVSPRDWDELNKVITEFDTKFNNWNRTWSNTAYSYETDPPIPVKNDPYKPFLKKVCFSVS